MKMRIKGNSLRLRVSRSELTLFANGTRVKETIHFGPQPEARLTYALETDATAKEIRTKYLDREVVVQIPLDVARDWERTDLVGISHTMHLGSAGDLHILVEKDFACLDKGDAENEDTFANPHATC